MREAVGLLDRSDRGLLIVSGGDRFTWLLGMVSNDVRPLAEGKSAVYACILDATGHLRTDLRIVRRESDLLLDLPRARLRAYRPETSIAEKTEAMVRLALANSRRTSSMYIGWPTPELSTARRCGSQSRRRSREGVSRSRANVHSL